MKIICINGNYANAGNLPQEPVFFLKADTSLLIRNRPFFVPNFDDNIHCKAELVVKVNRIGKHISSKFAHKYYSELAVGVSFVAQNLQDDLEKKSLPWDLANCFDFSAAVSAFIPLNDLNINDLDIELKINTKTVQKFNTSNMNFPVDNLIEYLSKFISFRIGDYLYTGSPEPSFRVSQGDNLQLFLNGSEMMNFEIK